MNVTGTCLKAAIRGLFLTLIACFLMPSIVFASTVFFQPGPNDGIDANWYSWPPNPSNKMFGNVSFFEVRTIPSFKGRGLLKFDLSPILSNMTINNALLQVFVTNNFNSANDIVYANRATSSWAELPNGTVFPPPTYDNLHQSSSLVPVSNGSWMDFDITDMLGDWVDTPSSNYGIVFESDAYSVFFSSSDHGTASYRPKLTVDYSASTVPEPATMALFGLGLLGTGAIRRKRK